MASNTAATVAPVTANQSEKLVISQADRVFMEEITASVNDLNSFDFTLTSAQILALNATPVTICNAPSRIPTIGNPTTISTTAGVQPGYVIIPDKVIMYYKAGGTAYTINGSTGFSIQLNSVEIMRLPVTGVIDQTSDKMACAYAEAPAAVGPITAANTGLTVTSLTASPTLGTGTVSLRVYVTLVPANF